jgi:[ribosomal protein S5]-alanine N-acetyltransferase
MIEMHNDRVKLLRGQTLGIDTDLIERVCGWLNDKEHMRFSEQRHKTHTSQSMIEYRKGFDQVTSLLWDIYYNLNDGYHIGTISAYIDEPNKRAEMGILIGPKYCGFGLGTSAWTLAMRYLQSRVEAIFAGMMLENIGMQKICKHCDMVPAGFVFDYFILENHRESALFYKWKQSQ